MAKKKRLFTQYRQVSSFSTERPANQAITMCPDGHELYSPLLVIKLIPVDTQIASKALNLHK